MLRAPGAEPIRYVLKPLVWATALVPAAWMGWAIWRAWQGDPAPLGTDPAETLIHHAGELAIRFLVAALLIGSLRDLFGWNRLVRLRRLVGLWACAWAFVHLGFYTAFELEFSLRALGEDLVERPYILAGAVALLAMVPLAVTSTRGWQRRLGPAWQRLHRAVYLAAAAACVHLIWQARSDLGEALLYTAIFAMIGAQRLHRWRARRTTMRPA